MGTIIPTFPGWQQGDTVVVHRIFLPGPHKKDQLGRWLLPLLQARKCPFPSIAFAGFVMLLLFHVRFPLLSSPSAKQQQQAPLPPSPRLVKCRRSVGGECTKVERRGPCTAPRLYASTALNTRQTDSLVGGRREGKDALLEPSWLLHVGRCSAAAQRCNYTEMVSFSSAY